MGGKFYSVLADPSCNLLKKLPPGVARGVQANDSLATMRISVRLIVAMILGVMLISFVFADSQVQAQKRSLRNDLERRAQVLAESLAVSIEPLLPNDRSKKLGSLVERFGNRERLAGVAVYDSRATLLAMTAGLAGRLHDLPSAVGQALAVGQSRGGFFPLAPAAMHIYVQPLDRDGSLLGALAIFHDAGYIEAQSARIWRQTFRTVLAQALLISLVTLLIVRWSIVGPIAKTAQWLRELRVRGSMQPPNLLEEDLFKPLLHEVRHLTVSLASARAAAEEEARLREASESLWTAERLRIHVQQRLAGSPLLAVSNREPYMHVHRGKSVEVVVPASGLVTALEPILRACDGTWIAHGAGDADRETVDGRDRLRVPPDDPQYPLRRVWLTKEEEQGYYFGFANEGIWPLCHIAHTRPTFRTEDWEQYRRVNQKFAQAVLEEIDGVESPAVLVQDYHFALLPQLVKQERPDARLAIFWHIPWPNPEAFGICPWQREMLEGLLGADLIGFHIQSHCNNFLQTVDSVLESRIEWERFAVNRRDHLTLVRPFPISVEFRETPEGAPAERETILRELGVQNGILGVGVDRVDYTKGIPERFRGIERFLEKFPAYQGRFTFVQIGAPSRTEIPRYRNFCAEVEQEADRINRRFEKGKWKPIVLLKKHHGHREIERLYRAADVCLVTSLHDGMNLVAKEFVAARHDERGVLILSRFTGASRELRDALLVNPYDIEQLAEAIRLALELDPEEARARMRRMRRIVREHNVYRWAATLVTDLSEIPIEETASIKTVGTTA